MHKTIIKRRLATILLYTYWPISSSLLRLLLLLWYMHVDCRLFFTFFFLRLSCACYILFVCFDSYDRAICVVAAHFHSSFCLLFASDHVDAQTKESSLLDALLSRDKNTKKTKNNTILCYALKHLCIGRRLTFRPLYSLKEEDTQKKHCKSSQWRTLIHLKIIRIYSVNAFKQVELLENEQSNCTKSKPIECIFESRNLCPIHFSAAEFRFLCIFVFIFRLWK